MIRVLTTVLTSVALCSAGLFPIAAAAAEFPVFDGSGCTALTSKMLDPVEKANETQKCWSEDGIARDHLIAHWSLVTDEDLADCMKHPAKSYTRLKTCLADKIGWRCFKDELRCQMPP